MLIQYGDKILTFMRLAPLGGDIMFQTRFDFRLANSIVPVTSLST
jgi:hypothetical protein